MATATIPTVEPSRILAERAVIPKSMEPLEVELHTLYRELPRLLSDGVAGRFAVIRGTQIDSLWDTRHDASQYAHEKFDDPIFLTQKIDPRLLPELVRIFGPYPDPEATADADS